MEQKILARGFEAIGWGALAADCQLFAGCPTSPEDEIFTYLAQEFPKNGRHFVRASSEVSAINIAYGSTSAGGRVMVVVASAGWGLIQETMSHLVNAFLPVVVVLIQRGGPGAGSLRHAQMDYLPITRDAGQGNYRVISLAPSSVQETYDLMQLAFHLADKWRNPVIVATDTIIIRMMEPLTLKTIKLGPPLPEKDWIVKGKEHQTDGIRRFISSGQGFIPTRDFSTYLHFLKGLNEKVLRMRETEARYESYELEDAEIVLVAYGYSARVCQEALMMARAEGIKAGLMRPVTLWPFPGDVLKKKALKGAKFLTVEDGLEGLREDVMLAVEGQAEIEWVNVLDRNESGAGGAIYPGKVLEKMRKLLKGKVKVIKKGR